MTKIKLAVVIMAKNESKRILISIESVKNSISGLFLYDTGSTDNTVEIVKDFCLKHNIKFFLLEGVFEDFATSRNKLLNFADTVNNQYGYHYYVLLDSNDEYKCKTPLINVIDQIVLLSAKPKVLSEAANTDSLSGKLQPNTQFSNTEQTKYITTKLKKQKQKKDHKIQPVDLTYAPHSFMIHQQWFVGGDSYIDYYNIRIIRTNYNFKYVGCVHEYIVEPKNCVTYRLNDDIILFQDRVADNDGKTCARWENDLKLLLNELNKNPNDARSQYYTAQTFSCLGRKEEAFKYFAIRAANLNGFFEERFLSMYQCGILSNNTNNYEAASWFLGAFQVIQRAEPLIELCKMFRLRNQFKLAYYFANLACQLDFPNNCLLWVDRKCYDHDRWSELGIVAYYVGKYKKGELACERAINSGYNMELNKHNLKWYTNRKLNLQ